jgi:Domain of unknown function (DUF4234)
MHEDPAHPSRQIAAGVDDQPAAGAYPPPVPTPAGAMPVVAATSFELPPPVNQAAPVVGAQPAAFSKEVVMAGEKFKLRNPFAVWIGLPIITLGIYYFVWYYKVNNEAKRFLRDSSMNPALSVLAITLGAIVVVPYFMSVYRTAKRIRRMQENSQVQAAIKPWVAALLVFVLGSHTLYMQRHLNKIWIAYQQAFPAFA